eukprot:3394208-Prymnesium_polylepis.1
MAKPTLERNVRSEPRGPKRTLHAPHGLRVCARALKSSEVRFNGRYSHMSGRLWVRVAQCTQPNEVRTEHYSTGPMPPAECRTGYGPFGDGTR